MSFINYSSREINCKIVYYGPGRCGKTTNLQYIYGKIPDEKRSSMVSLATEKDRTLFFDFLPLELGEIAGYKTISRNAIPKRWQSLFPVANAA